MQEYNGYFYNKYFFDDLGLLVAEYSPYIINNEDVETVEVEGRSGTLTIKKGTYKDKEKTLKFRLPDKNFNWDKIDYIENWLKNIEDNRLIYDRVDRAYRVKRVVFSNIARELKLYKEFEVNFICDPFFTDLEESVEVFNSNSGIIYYNGTEEGTPIIEIEGNGNIQIDVNGEIMQIENVEGYVKVDCDLLQVLNKDGLSKDWDSTGEFPYLLKGENSINISGSVKKITITYINKYR